jgi:organic radical activating enzyme
MEKERLDQHIPVSEIFYSIQGEGLNAGIPAVFLRTYYCNLTCEWCDTKYTWQNQDEALEGRDYTHMTCEDVVRKIMTLPSRHVVVTGGEPLIHQDILGKALSSLKNMGYYIEIETNGTITPSQSMVDNIDCFNVSPKTSNSLVPLKLRLHPASIGALRDTGKACFKFVVSKPDDIEEIEDFVKANSLPRSRIFLMPEAVDRETLSQKSSWVVQLCKEGGLRYSSRLHIWLYGNARGF